MSGYGARQARGTSQVRTSAPNPTGWCDPQVMTRSGSQRSVDDGAKRGRGERPRGALVQCRAIGVSIDVQDECDEARGADRLDLDYDKDYDNDYDNDNDNDAEGMPELTCPGYQ
jgi:hypothetical protein